MSESNELHDLASAYLLDALDEQERVSFEAHLSDCVTCRRELARMSNGVDRMLAEDATTPPPALKDRVMESITPQADAAEPAEKPRMWRRWVAGAAAIVLVFAGGWAMGRMTAPQGIDGVLTAADARTVTVGEHSTLIYSEDLRQGVLDMTDLDDPPHDHDYQVWLIDTGPPVSAAVVENPSMTLLSGDFAGSTVVAVTVEPDGGSPQPTTDPFASAEIPPG